MSTDGRHIPVQRTTIEPASGRSSYYPHESTSYYNTGSRGGGGGSSVTYVLPSSNGHKRYGSTTQLPSPLKYASLSRRNSGNVGGQSLVVPRAGSRFASPVVGEFSHELSQRSPGIPPPCPELPTPADRGHLAPHLPSNYSGRAHGAMRSYHHFGQEQAFVEIAGAKRPSTLPIGMHASSHRYSPSALPRASTFSELSITDAPEPSPSRAHTFNCAYNTPAIYEPVPPLPTSYLPQASPSSTLYDPHSSTFAPSYQDCPEYPESSTETFVNPEEDPYTNPFDYSTSGRYARDYSLPVDSSAYQPSFGTPQEETGTPFDSDSDTIFDSTVNHESEFDQFVEKVSIEHHAPAASVDTSYKLPSPPLSYATTTGTTGRYASTGKPKPAPIIVEPLPEHKPVAAKPSRRNPYSNMAAPGVKAPHFDTSTLTPEEQDDEYSRNDGLDDFCSREDSLNGN
ncbi:hypothetical protein BJ508DRAFT_100759 [Ascobolus immersus RN42]|uniref:Uncharacterized protein n=1 Tax=Ascobolus immersus RN42 TaxID=1160509 RepID=A0A3N4I7N1_ASCIM|nr:hypothetical protein BJ508DRAFT_100759 [Ascobolus immersus RN42]